MVKYNQHQLGGDSSLVSSKQTKSIQSTLSQKSTQPKSRMLSISPSGRLSRNPTQPKSRMLPSKPITPTTPTTSTKNRKKVHSHVFERNLFQSRRKYLEYLLESIFDLIQNKTPVVSTNYNNMSARLSTMLGGDIKKIVFNIPSENNAKSNLQILLCLDNLHDFAVGGDNNVAKYFQNSDELLQKANTTFTRKDTRPFGISTFESVMFLRLVGEYSRKNPISFICEDTLKEYYTKYINVDGDIFIDTTPVSAYQVYNNNHNIEKIRKTLATYFDPSPTEADEIHRYSNDIQLFNNAIKILKQNYFHLNDVDIELSTDNTNENFVNRKYIFNIGTKKQFNRFEFSTGQNGDFSINSIQKYIHGQNNLSENIVRLREKLTDDQLISFLVLMKALGDFSQLFFAFNLNDKTNLIATVDKWLFTIGIHCLLYTENIFNKDLFMLIGTGNTTEDKSRSRGSKILIYDDKEFFSGKTLRGIFESKYKNVVNFIFKPNEKKYHIWIKDLKNQEYLIKTVTIEQIDTVITSDILNVNIERFKDISFLLDISLEAISTIDESNTWFNSYESKFNELTKKMESRLQTSILTQTLQEIIIANYEEIAKELKFEIGLLMKAENANLTEKIKTDIAGIRDKYKKLLEQVQEIKNTLVVMIENEPRGRKRNRTVETTENQNKRGRFNGGHRIRKSKNKEVIKKTIQKKQKNQKHSDVKIMSTIGGKTTKLEPKNKEVIKKTIQKTRKNQKHSDVETISTIGGKNNKTTKLEPKNKEVIKKTIQKKPENQKTIETKSMSTIGGKKTKTTKIESKTKEVIKKTIQKKQKNQKSNEVKIISTKVKNLQ
jgi:hypothetical protein